MEIPLGKTENKTNNMIHPWLLFLKYRISNKTYTTRLSKPT